MRVAFAINDGPDEMSGVISWTRHLLAWLHSAGVEVEAHVIREDGSPSAHSAWLADHGVRVRSMPVHLHTPTAVRHWLRMLEEGQPDVYCPNCMIPAYFAAGYAREQGIGTIGILHSDDPVYWGIIDEFVHCRSKRRLSALVAVSEFIESSARAAVRGLTPVERIGYGITLPKTKAAAPDSTFRLVYLGRLVERQKRISEVTRALCAAVAMDPRIEAWIVGDGDARAEVEAIVAASGVGSRIRLFGHVENHLVPDLISQCHALVLLSDFEGLPVSVLEGMAGGLVPICLDMRSGIRELINPGANGLIVRDRGPDFLSSVRSLSGDLSQWRRLSEAARETVTRDFNFENEAGKWLRLLQTVNGQRVRKAAFRAPAWIRLPPQNPKFGFADCRLPLTKRPAVVGARMRFGAWRRSALGRLAGKGAGGKGVHE